MKNDGRIIKVPFTTTCCYNEYVNVCNFICKQCDYYGLCEQTVNHKCRQNLSVKCTCCGDCLK